MTKKNPRPYNGARKIEQNLQLCLHLLKCCDHRIEIFDDTAEPNRAAPSGDFGLIFTRELGWAAWETSLDFVPSFQVSGDYFVRHESSLNLLRSAGPLSLRVGLANNFRSKPLPTQVKTDTAYFLRTTYVWK